MSFPDSGEDRDNQEDVPMGDTARHIQERFEEYARNMKNIDEQAEKSGKPEDHPLTSNNLTWGMEILQEYGREFEGIRELIEDARKYADDEDKSAINPFQANTRFGFIEHQKNIQSRVTGTTEFGETPVLGSHREEKGVEEFRRVLKTTMDGIKDMPEAFPQWGGVVRALNERDKALEERRKKDTQEQ